MLIVAIGYRTLEVIGLDNNFIFFKYLVTQLPRSRYTDEVSKVLTITQLFYERLQMSDQLRQLMEENAALKAAALENAALKAAANFKPIGFKVSEKGALSVYGLGRFPVTLYKGQWERLIQAMPSLQIFMANNTFKEKD